MNTLAQIDRGRRIQAIRVALNLSINAIATAAKVTRPAYCAWESGEASIRPKNLSVLLKVLHAHVDARGASATHPAMIRDLEWVEFGPLWANRRPPPPPQLRGRADLLGRISRSLKRTPKIALSGPPGIGKTALAERLARDGLYRVVWWINASSRYRMVSGLLDLSETLGRRRAPTESREIAKFAEWLGRQPAEPRRAAPFLLVLDDACDLRLFDGLLTTKTQGHIIATTTADRVPPGWARVEVPLLESSSAYEVLAQDGAVAHAEALAATETLGGNPGALHLAASLPSAILTQDLLHMSARDAEAEPVGVVVGVSLSKATTATRWLGQACAHLATATISRDMLEHCRPDRISTSDFEDALAALVAVRFAAAHARGIFMHSSVSAALRRQDSAQSALACTDVLRGLLSCLNARPSPSEDPDDNPDRRAQRETLNQHVDAATAYAAQLKCAPALASAVLFKASFDAGYRGRNRIANNWSARAIKHLERAPDATAVEIALCRCNLAQNLVLLFDVEAAHGQLRRALPVLEGGQAPAHALHVCRCCLSDVLNRLGRAEDALSLAQQAVQALCAEDALFADEALRAHNAVGDALLSQNDLVGARTCFETALGLGPRGDSPVEQLTRAVGHLNLGRVLARMKHASEADQLQAAALQTCAKILGPGHLLTALVRFYYAQTLLALGEDRHSKREMRAAKRTLTTAHLQFVPDAFAHRKHEKRRGQASG